MEGQNKVKLRMTAKRWKMVRAGVKDSCLRNDSCLKY